MANGSTVRRAARASHFAARKHPTANIRLHFPREATDTYIRYYQTELDLLDSMSSNGEIIFESFSDGFLRGKTEGMINLIIQRNIEGECALEFADDVPVDCFSEFPEQIPFSILFSYLMES
jgi:hypothetical protein